MKLTLEKVIGAIVVVVLGYMIYTHFLSRPTMVKIQKGKHKQSKSKGSFCQSIQQTTLQSNNDYDRNDTQGPCNIVGNNCNLLLCKNDPNTTSEESLEYCIQPTADCLLWNYQKGLEEGSR